MSDPLQLEAYLQEHIPLSLHLGVRVLQASEDGVRLLAPLGPNLNHRQTAFGGSLSALAILSGWSLLWLRLRDLTEGHRIVIHSNSISYLAPVRADFEAVCSGVATERWSAFMKTFSVRGRARLELEAQIHAEDRLVAEFSGRYVVFRPGAFA